MLTRFTTKPYVAVVYSDIIWPDDAIDKFKIISSPNEYKSIGSFFGNPSIFTSIDKLLIHLNNDLTEFIKNNGKEKIGASKGIRLQVNGGGDEFGDADLEFTMPGIKLNELRDIFQYSDNKFLSYLINLDEQNGIKQYKSPDDFQDFNVHDFSFYYYVIRFVNKKPVYHLTYVDFVEVNK